MVSVIISARGLLRATLASCHSRRTCSIDLYGKVLYEGRLAKDDQLPRESSTQRVVTQPAAGAASAAADSVRQAAAVLLHVQKVLFLDSRRWLEWLQHKRPVHPLARARRWGATLLLPPAQLTALGRASSSRIMMRSPHFWIA